MKIVNTKIDSIWRMIQKPYFNRTEECKYRYNLEHYIRPNKFNLKNNLHESKNSSLP